MSFSILNGVSFLDTTGILSENLLDNNEFVLALYLIYVKLEENDLLQKLSKHLIPFPKGYLNKNISE